MSRKPTPPCTPVSSNHRHSIGAPPSKKPLPVFNSYMSLFQVQEKLKKGEVIEGVLRINPKSYEDAYISAPEGGTDIFIGGVRDRNTALHGDIVAAMINPPQEWKVLSSQLDAYLEQHLDLKSLVYTPLEPIISNSDNAFTSTLSSTIKKNTTNTETHIANKIDVVVEESLEPQPQHQSKEHPKKKKKHRRGKKKAKEELIICDIVVLQTQLVEDSVEVISCPSVLEVAASTREEVANRHPTNTKGAVVVPPHELSECDLTDDESVNSLTLDIEEHLSLRGPSATESIMNEDALANGIKPISTEKADVPFCTNLQLSKPGFLASGEDGKKSRRSKAQKKKKQQKRRKDSDAERAQKTLEPEKQIEEHSPTLPEGKEPNGRTQPSVLQIQRLVNWDNFVQKTAVVVHILERKHPMVAAGSLKLFADKNPHLALFSPFDGRIPRIKIQMHKCPDDFPNRSADYARKIFLAKITEWNDPKFAFGDLVRDIGQVGDIEAEVEALLLENNIDDSEFPRVVNKNLPSDPWTIPQEEIDRRTDLRSSIVFTVDPAGARDLDDAVSCLPLPSGNFRVGVHIADVSYFVSMDSVLDGIAASRANSVYLVHKVIPMLPRELCEDLCSLNPGEDRLAFSVIWEMTAEGTIEGEWFGRTVIRSCAKLHYEHIQEMIEHPNQQILAENFPPIEGHSVSEICCIVNNLHKIAVQLRQKRIRDGALRLDQVKLNFTVDVDSLAPNSIFVHQIKDSNKLIEELMLLANISVAQKIHDTFPTDAVLRRHPAPHDFQLQNMVKFFDVHGVHLNPVSSRTLNESIQKYAGTDPLSIARMQVIVNMCSKPMQYARYFCTGLESKPECFRHYALNVPRYTHFTSPIRRYADIMVHRLLAAAVDSVLYPLPPWNKKTIGRIAKHCNDKKQSAKVVQEVCCDLFLALFIRNVGEMVERGMIVGVLDRSVDVMITRLGVIKRCYMEKLPLKSFRFIQEEHKNTLNIEWKEDARLNLPSFTQKLSYFDCVTVTLRPFENDALRFNAFLARSDVPLF